MECTDLFLEITFVIAAVHMPSTGLTHAQSAKLTSLPKGSVPLPQLLPTLKSDARFVVTFNGGLVTVVTHVFGFTPDDVSALQSDLAIGTTGTGTETTGITAVTAIEVHHHIVAAGKSGIERMAAAVVVSR